VRKFNVIEYNYINGATQVLDDGGAIYTYNGADYARSASEGSIVRKNIILNVHGNADGWNAFSPAGHAIYMDDGIRDVLIEDNVVSNTHSGIFSHVNGRIQIKNNLVFDSIVHFLVAKKHEDSSVTNNIFYATSRRGSTTWWRDTHQRLVLEDGASINYDYNTYVHHYQTASIFSGNRDFETWRLATGDDSHSTFDGTPMPSGYTEKLIYNAKTTTQTIDLKGRAFKDISGGSVEGSLTLAPFTAKILIGTNFDGINSVDPSMSVSTTLPPTNPPLEEPITEEPTPTNPPFEETIQSPDFPSPKAKYSFEETSGTTIQDKVGSNSGILYNEQNRVEGIKGKGLEFTGQGYVNLGKNFGNIREKVTLSAWIKPSSTTASYQGIIMQGGPVDDTFAMYIKSDSKILAFKTTSTSNSWTSIPADSLWDGNWHHVVATYDGSKKTIYLDGGILTSVSATGLIESGEGNNLLLGAGRDTSVPTLLYEGLIDEVTIFNVSLNSTQVNTLYKFEDEIIIVPETIENSTQDSTPSDSGNAGKGSSKSRSSKNLEENNGSEIKPGSKEKNNNNKEEEIKLDEVRIREISQGEKVQIKFLNLTKRNYNSVKENDSLVEELSFEDENHEIVVEEVGENFAVVTVNSEKQTINLSVGESKALEINGDDNFDLNITLNFIEEEKVNLSVAYIYVEMSEEEKIASDALKKESNTKEFFDFGGVFFWIISSLIFVSIGVVLFKFVLEEKKRRQARQKFFSSLKFS
jgi:hypothetical protein